MIGFIVAGLIIGALARLIKPGKQQLGILATLLLGLVGSVIGGTIANLLGTGDIFELNVLGFIFAVIAALLLIGVAEGIAQKRHKSVGAILTVLVLTAFRAATTTVGSEREGEHGAGVDGGEQDAVEAEAPPAPSLPN